MGQLELEDRLQPELTRNEYLRLLQTAKFLGKERIYLLVKVFASTGIYVQDLSRVTVEAAKAERLVVSAGNVKQMIHLPVCLCRELLDYAGRTGILSGPIFITRNGTPMNRTAVSTCILQLSEAAQIPKGKGNPRCLRKLYLTTRASIEDNISLLVEQAMNRQLEQEQLTVGWGG